MERMRTFMEKQKIVKKQVRYEDELQRRANAAPFVQLKKQLATALKVQAVVPKSHVTTATHANNMSKSHPHPIHNGTFKSGPMHGEADEKMSQPKLKPIKVKVSVGINTTPSVSNVENSDSKTNVQEIKVQNTSKTQNRSKSAPKSSDPSSKRNQRSQQRPQNAPQQQERNHSKTKVSKSKSSPPAPAPAPVAAETPSSAKPSQILGGNKPYHKINGMISAAEAAAKLSLPWPSPSAQKGQENENPDEVRKDGFQLNNFSGGKNDQMTLLQEMQKMLDDHGGGGRWVRGKNGNMQLEMDDSLAAIMDSYMLNKFSTRIFDIRGKSYLPSAPPKWEEVETNWPGFERKPVANWMDYATPSKILQGQSQSDKKTEREPDNNKSKNEGKKEKRHRMVHHLGTCLL